MKRRAQPSSLSFLLWTTLVLSIPCHGQWSIDPAVNTPVCTTAYQQQYPAIAPDGKGGAIIAWQDGRDGVSTDIYAQRIGADGTAEWGGNGIPVTDGPGDQTFPVVVADRSGGAIIVWGTTSQSPVEVRAQRVDSTGAFVWPDSGTRVSGSADDWWFPEAVASDSSDGVIVTVVKFGTMYYDGVGSHSLVVQRIDSQGIALWGDSGVTAGRMYRSYFYFPFGPIVGVADGGGGLVLAWTSLTGGGSGPPHVYAQHIDAGGMVLWDTAGVDLGPGIEPQIITDGSGGAIVSWSEWSEAFPHVQRIDSSGTALWTAGGVPLASSQGTVGYTRIATDNDGGAFVVWSGDDGPRVQRVDSDGLPLWIPGGVTLWEAEAATYPIQIEPDGLGGAVVVWTINLTGTTDLRAQRFDSSGRILWTTEGADVSNAPFTQSRPAAVSAGPGTFIVAWQDSRNGTDADIFAQMVGEGGNLGAPAFHTGVRDGWNLLSAPISATSYREESVFPGAESRAYTYSGKYAQCDQVNTSSGYWIKYPGAGSVPMTGVLRDNDTVTIVPGWNMIGSAGEPLGVASLQSDPPGLATTEFFGFDEDYFVADTILPGRAYWVKASSAGKIFLMPPGENGYAARIRIVPTSEQPPTPPAGIENEEHPKAFSLLSNYPNPFNSTTTITFTLPAGQRVSLNVFNILGERTAALVDGWLDAGAHTIEWDAGNLPGGIYFCELRAGEATQTVKLVLMK